MYSDDFCKQIAQVLSTSMALNRAINALKPDPQNLNEGRAYLNLKISYSQFLDHLQKACPEH